MPSFNLLQELETLCKGYLEECRHFNLEEMSVLEVSVFKSMVEKIHQDIIEKMDSL